MLREPQVGAHGRARAGGARTGARPAGRAASVRPARPEDAGELARISAPFAAADRLLSRSPDAFAQRIDDFLVAVHGNTLAGCMGLLPVPHCLVIYNLCVSQEFQGRGIGQILVRQAVRRAGENGYVFVLAASKHGGAWFARQGFHEVDTESAPEEWRRLSPPGRNSALYCLRLEDR
ncbi:GNAT family N-acetyltransferase [Streptomyces actinomycinicus]|uniref:GNAT family N-acetyltransferase n=1 Tax=Streptomyces actinomycinicus TaxID=1695166 RepID=A0A937JMH2_9ACTN|nr:GNAT family N-acetyltransferase [Streptomyces actinomycinicus]MBL1082316.1 GNAT family N-acetyltransferase [Streptomyces actinomycinicus]